MAFEKYSTSGILLYAVPLYVSPVLAGASAAPWTAVPVFAALFSALVLKTRATPDAAGPLAVSVVLALILHGAIASALFALGRGLAVLTGPLPVPVWAALAICAAAAAFGIWRYRWTPEQAEMDALLDDALDTLSQVQIDESDRD
jgi:hypothetical protein